MAEITVRVQCARHGTNRGFPSLLTAITAIIMVPRRHNRYATKKERPRFVPLFSPVPRVHSGRGGGGRRGRGKKSHSLTFDRQALIPFRHVGTIFELEGPFLPFPSLPRKAPCSCLKWKGNHFLKRGARIWVIT